MSNIGYFLELTQVGLGDEVFAHTDPVSQKEGASKRNVSEKVNFFNFHESINDLVCLKSKDDTRW